MKIIPHLKFLHTLIAHKTPYGEASKELDSCLLPPISGQDYKALYDAVYKTDSNYFDDPKGKPDEQWLKDLDILELYSYKYEYPVGAPKDSEFIINIMPGAVEILNDPLMRRAIQALAIAGTVPEEDIELIINGKYDITYMTDNFVMFMKYFFDIKGWTLSKKTDYVKNLHPSQQVFKSMYVIALKHDKDFLLWKLGLAPDKSFDQMLRDIGNDCYYNFKEKMGHDPEMALKYGALLNKVIERIDKVDKDQEDKTTFFQQISFHMKEEEGFNGIANDKKRKELDIDIPTLDMGEAPDIETLQRLSGSGKDESEDN